MKTTIARRAMPLIVMALITQASGPATGDDVYWQAGVADWSGPGNWNPDEPGQFDVAYINNAGTAQVTQAGETCSWLILAESVGQFGTVDVPGGDLAVSGLIEVGRGGVGTLTHTGGSVSAINLYLGAETGGEGAYDLGGTGQLLTEQTVVGVQGAGTFNQTDGAHVVNGDFTVGQNGSGMVTHSGGTASCAALVLGGLGSGYALSGTGALTAGDVHVGYGTDNACGFGQTGGTCTINNNLFLHSLSGGAYWLSGGTLTIDGNIARPAGDMSGGFLDINGGTAQVAGNIAVSTLNVGSGLGAVGLFEWSGEHDITTGNLSVGTYGGIGTMTQTGGTVVVESWFTMADGPVAEGTYHLGGTGRLEARDAWLGAAGAATLDLSAGACDVQNDLILGAYETGNATCHLDAGTLTVGRDLIVGWKGTGAFNQSGGTCQVAGTLYVAQEPGSSGAVSLSGSARLSAPTVQLNAGGTFAQTGGDLIFTTFNQDGGTVYETLHNPGTFNYNSGPFLARLINEGVVNLTRDFTAGDGIDNRTSLAIPSGRTVTCGGGGLDNSGTITMGGGTLAGDGPLVSNALIEGTGTITGSAGFVNNGSLLPTGLMTLSNTGANANYGRIALTPYRQLRLAGGALANHGMLELNDALVAGPAALDNAAGGTLQGPGTIVCPFANTAGLILVPPGTVNVLGDVASGGIIRLTAATSVFTGGDLSNTGVVEGQGNVGNDVVNTGTIEALGGTLTLGGSVFNGAGGLMTAAAGAKIVATGALAGNDGTIHLEGGTFDAAGRPVTSAGLISGYGTLRTGGLSNLGDLTLTGGASTVTGEVTNQASGRLRVLYDTAVFTGDVTNYGTVKVTDTTVVFAGRSTERRGWGRSNPAHPR